MLVAQALNSRVGDAVSAHVVPRNGGASVSGANWAHDSSETLCSSFTLRHHAQMQANAVVTESSVGAVALALIFGVSDAVSAHVVPRSGGASVFVAAGALATYGTLSSHAVISDSAQMLANAVAQRAAW